MGGVTSNIVFAILGKRHLRIIDTGSPRALVQDIFEEGVDRARPAFRIRVACRLRGTLAARRSSVSCDDIGFGRPYARANVAEEVRQAGKG